MPAVSGPNVSAEYRKVQVGTHSVCWVSVQQIRIAGRARHVLGQRQQYAGLVQQVHVMPRLALAQRGQQQYHLE